MTQSEAPRHTGSMVIFHAPDIGLDHAVEAFGASWTIERHDKFFAVQQDSDGPRLVIELRGGPEFRESLDAIAQGTGFAKRISGYDTWFHIHISDPDTVLSEANTLLESQRILTKLTGGVVYNLWGKRMFDPNEDGAA